MPSGTFNHLLWAGLILVLAVLGYMTRANLGAFYDRVGQLEVRDKPDDSTVVLHWKGKIDAPMEGRITEAFERYRDGRKTFVLTLSSPGGSVAHGARVVRLLNKMAETHKIETVVDAGQSCASMCVPVYLQGQRRSAAASAKFLFHRVSFSEYLAREQIAVPEQAKDRETDKFFAKYFKQAGVPEAWISQVRTAMAGNADIWKTARELVDENAGIVQQIRE